MIRNHLKTAWRNILKHKYGSAINILGLSVGMAASALVFLWVQNEMSFDNYHDDKDNIYSLGLKRIKEAGAFPGTPLPLAEEIKKQVPEVDKVARIMIPGESGAPNLKIRHDLFKAKDIAYVDKEWFDIFDYEFTSAGSHGFGVNPNSIIITETVARKYYGDGDPVGQVIRIDSLDFSIDGVVKANPPNSSFRFGIYLPLAAYLKRNLREAESWPSFKDQTFIKLSGQGSVSTVENKINAILSRQDQLGFILAGDKEDGFVSQLAPLTSFHFIENSFSGMQFVKGDKRAVYNFSLLGFLILVVACINYVNLTTARAGKRSKEVGIKKIVGAEKSNLFLQFITESTLTGTIALLMALVVVKLSLPLFSQFTGTNFLSVLSSPQLWILLAAILLVSVALSGIYPAFLLSSFKPVNAVKGTYNLNLRGASLRKGLVVTQFAVSITLIVCSIVIARQLNYIYSNESYDRSSIFSVKLPAKGYTRDNLAGHEILTQTVKNELEGIAGVGNVTVTSDFIHNIQVSIGGNIDWVGKKEDAETVIYTPLLADSDFNKIFKLQLKEGRWFRENDPGDRKNYILNETAVRELNLREPCTGQFFR